MRNACGIGGQITQERKRMKPEIEALLKDKSGIRLDIGCGEYKQEGFVGMDRQALPGVDIVHDIEKFPWPLPDDCCLVIVGSHIIEHIRPELTVPLFDEMWRVMKPGGQLALCTPYAGSHGYWMDPTHVNGFNEATFYYFDPRQHLYKIYRPNPWHIVKGYPVWQVTGQIEVLMQKVLPEEVQEDGQVS